MYVCTACVIFSETRKANLYMRNILYNRVLTTLCEKVNEPYVYLYIYIPNGYCDAIIND